MGYKVDYGAMSSVLGSISSAVGEWSDGVSGLREKEAAVETSHNITGNSADRMKSYLGTVYSVAETSLLSLFELIYENFMLYSQDYYNQVDPAGDTHIDEMELNELRTELQNKRSRQQQIALSSEMKANSVSDLVDVPSIDFGEVDSKFSSILTSLDELDSAVNSLESAHVAGDFGEIDSLISQLGSYFSELGELNEDFKTSFTMESFAALASVPGLIAAVQDAGGRMDAQKSSVAAAIDALEKRYELEQQERAEREEEVKWKKVGVGIICGVITGAAAVVIPVGGAILVGGAFGAIKSFFNTAADEYVEHGWNKNQWDRKKIGINAMVGGITGIVSSAIPPGTGTLAKSSIKGLSSAFTTAVNTGYDQLSTGEKLDWGKIEQSAFISGTSSFAGNLVGSAVTDGIEKSGIGFIDKALDDPLSKGHFASTFAFEGVKDLGKGVIKRGVSNLTEQGLSHYADGTSLDAESLKEDMFSMTDMAEDLVGGGLKGATSDYLELRTPDKDTGLTPIIQYKLDPTDWANTSNTPDEILQMEEMEQNGEFNIGGEDYSSVESTDVFKEASAPTMRTAGDSSGSWLEEPGNSGFIPNNSEAQEVMKAYGQDHISIHGKSPDFSPFAKQDTPWGTRNCEVEIGHMTSERTGTYGNYYQADEELANMIGGGVTRDDVRHYREENKLTWHEVEDGKTMQLIPTAINASIPHTGGTSVSGYLQKMGDVSHEYE